jgi:hypothetical protein
LADTSARDVPRILSGELAHTDSKREREREKGREREKRQGQRREVKSQI